MVKYIVRRMFLLSNVAFAGLLLSAWMGSLYYWNSLTINNFIALFSPILFGINLGYLILGFKLYKKRSYVFLSMVPILLILPLGTRFVTYNEQKEGDEKAIKIMSYNVKMFTPYTESHSMEEINSYTEKNLRMIHKVQADIVCLQEYSARGAAIMKDYAYHEVKPHIRPLITLSKYPIVNTYSVDFQGKYGNNLITDIVISGDTLRVINVHLESLKLSLNLFNQPIKDEKELEDRSKYFYRNFSDSFNKHRLQIEALQEEISRSPHPVIMCGDFNNTPFSYEYTCINKVLADTYKLRGNGIADTYHPIKFPTRIDHIFVSPVFNVHKYAILSEEKISDHYPVLVTMSWKD